MKARHTEHTRIDRLEQGEWLYELLKEARKDVAAGPSAAAIKRIRARLQSQMARPQKVAA